MIILEDTGVRMSIDRGKLSKAAKKKTIKALEDAIRQLKD
jgi:hypothetical protein